MKRKRPACPPEGVDAQPPRERLRIVERGSPRFIQVDAEISHGVEAEREVAVGDRLRLEGRGPEGEAGAPLANGTLEEGFLKPFEVKKVTDVLQPALLVLVEAAGDVPDDTA